MFLVAPHKLFINCPHSSNTIMLLNITWMLLYKFKLIGNLSSGNYTNDKILMALSTLKDLSINYQHRNYRSESVNYRWYRKVENTISVRSSSGSLTIFHFPLSPVIYSYSAISVLIIDSQMLECGQSHEYSIVSVTAGRWIFKLVWVYTVTFT